MRNLEDTVKMKRNSDMQVDRGVAVRAFVGVAERWNIPKGDWPALLGKSSPNTVRSWIESASLGDPVGARLDADVAERISHLLSIYDGLHRLFGDGAYADRWIRLENAAFGGEAPLSRLRSGRFSDLYEIRIYVERALGA
jgi:hypothetical protein